VGGRGGQRRGQGGGGRGRARRGRRRRKAIQVPVWLRGPAAHRIQGLAQGMIQSGHEEDSVLRTFRYTLGTLKVPAPLGAPPPGSHHVQGSHTACTVYPWRGFSVCKAQGMIQSGHEKALLAHQVYPPGTPRTPPPCSSPMV